MKISILTLFPSFFKEIITNSIIGRAQKQNYVRINIVDIRKYSTDKYKTVDDRPYGGGTGMVMKVDILHKALKDLRTKNPKRKELVILTDPKGLKFNQEKAVSYLKFDHLIIICGHYEGVDQRIYHFIDEGISIGDYILTGGEIPSMAIMDSVIRLIPGVLKKAEAVEFESFSRHHKHEPPQYTRPPEYLGYKVPDVLISGNHKEIEKWKKENAI